MWPEFKQIKLFFLFFYALQLPCGHFLCSCVHENHGHFCVSGYLVEMCVSFKVTWSALCSRFDNRSAHESQQLPKDSEQHQDTSLLSFKSSNETVDNLYHYSGDLQCMSRKGTAAECLSTCGYFSRYPLPIQNLSTSYPQHTQLWKKNVSNVTNCG